MPNYIEKEAAVAEAKKRVEFALSANSRELLRTYNEVLKIINKQPVISIPEIVYCKDCANHGKCIFEDTFDTAHLQNGFCAAGTRKKNISQRNSAYIILAIPPKYASTAVTIIRTQNRTAIAAVE